MTNRVGLWIDHKQALIVSVDEPGFAVRKIESGVKHLEYRGGPHPRTPYSAQYSQGDDQLDNQFLQHLNKYYEQVISFLRGASSILIFGPGEAKSELVKRLARQKGNRPEISVLPADKMTDRQIVAKARDHFREQDAATTSRSRTLR